jgi:hypothetical protein
MIDYDSTCSQHKQTKNTFSKKTKTKKLAKLFSFLIFSFFKAEASHFSFLYLAIQPNKEKKEGKVKDKKAVLFSQYKLYGGVCARFEKNL